MSRSPSQAYTDAHDHVLHCGDLLTVVAMALDGKAGVVGPNEREAISTAVHRALDDVRAARECFPHIPRPKDPL